MASTMSGVRLPTSPRPGVDALLHYLLLWAIAACVICPVLTRSPGSMHTLFPDAATMYVMTCLEAGTMALKQKMCGSRPRTGAVIGELLMMASAASVHLELRSSHPANADDLVACGRRCRTTASGSGCSMGAHWASYGCGLVPALVALLRHDALAPCRSCATSARMNQRASALLPALIKACGRCLSLDRGGGARGDRSQQQQTYYGGRAPCCKLVCATWPRGESGWQQTHQSSGRTVC
jgi:hypothetical protein